MRQQNTTASTKTWYLFINAWAEASAIGCGSKARSHIKQDRRHAWITLSTHIARIVLKFYPSPKTWRFSLSEGFIPYKVWSVQWTWFVLKGRWGGVMWGGMGVHWSFHWCWLVRSFTNWPIIRALNRYMSQGNIMKSTQGGITLARVVVTSPNEQ